MTEDEWLKTTSLILMLRFLSERSGRKERLFAVACASRVVGWMRDERSRNAVEISERYADGLCGQKALSAARRAAFAASKDAERGEPIGNYYSAARHVAVVALNVTAADLQGEKNESLRATAGCVSSFLHHVEGGRSEVEETLRQVHLLRDIFGNPFRPVSFNPAWRTDTAVAVARTMYESRDFGAMPILADALQDDGCEDEQVLNHCREPGPHVRGCWVCDLVLGFA